MNESDKKQNLMNQKVKLMDETQKNKIIRLWNAFNNGFHKFGLWAIIFLIIGIYFGSIGTRTYYTSRVQESIKTENFLFQEKVYVIRPK